MLHSKSGKKTRVKCQSKVQWRLNGELSKMVIKRYPPRKLTSPLKIGLPKRKSIFQPSNFTGYVRFSEGNHSVNPSSVHFIWCMVIWGPNTLLDNPFNLTTPWKLIVFQAVNWELLRAPQTTSSHKWAHYGWDFQWKWGESGCVFVLSDYSKKRRNA